MDSERKKHITLMALGLAIGIIAGYSVGFSMGIKFTIRQGYYFLKQEGVEFHMTAEQIARLIDGYVARFSETRGDQSTIGEAIVQNG